MELKNVVEPVNQTGDKHKLIIIVIITDHRSTVDYRSVVCIMPDLICSWQTTVWINQSHDLKGTWCVDLGSWCSHLRKMQHQLALSRYIYADTAVRIQWGISLDNLPNTMHKRQTQNADCSSYLILPFNAMPQMASRQNLLQSPAATFFLLGLQSSMHLSTQMNRGRLFLRSG